MELRCRVMVEVQVVVELRRWVITEERGSRRVYRLGVW